MQDRDRSRLKTVCCYGTTYDLEFIASSGEATAASPHPPPASCGVVASDAPCGVVAPVGCGGFASCADNSAVALSCSVEISLYGRLSPDILILLHIDFFNTGLVQDVLA
jgi:hypothetical protein